MLYTELALISMFLPFCCASEDCPYRTVPFSQVRELKDVAEAIEEVQLRDSGPDDRLSATHREAIADLLKTFRECLCCVYHDVNVSLKDKNRYLGAL